MNRGRDGGWLEARRMFVLCGMIILQVLLHACCRKGKQIQSLSTGLKKPEVKSAMLLSLILQGISEHYLVAVTSHIL